LIFRSGIDLDLQGGKIISEGGLAMGDAGGNGKEEEPYVDLHIRFFPTLGTASLIVGPAYSIMFYGMCEFAKELFRKAKGTQGSKRVIPAQIVPPTIIR